MKDATATAFTVAKSTVELYKIRPATGCAWADITIDAHERGGRISIASDYGNWQNYWGAVGCDFKQFLSGLSRDYAAGKFGAEPINSVERTVKFYLELLGEYRRDESIDAKTARAIYTEIKELRATTPRSLVAWMEGTNHLLPFAYKFCGVPEVLTEDDPHFRRFWKEIWPVLLAEFAREKSAPATPTKQEGSVSHE